MINQISACSISIDQSETTEDQFEIHFKKYWVRPKLSSKNDKNITKWLKKSKTQSIAASIDKEPGVN